MTVATLLAQMSVSTISGSEKEALKKSLDTELNSLSSLDLGFKQLGDTAITYLAEALLHNTTLTSLNLIGNTLSTDNLQQINSLMKSNETLVELSLFPEDQARSDIEVEIWRNLKRNQAIAKIIAQGEALGLSTTKIVSYDYTGPHPYAFKKGMAIGEEKKKAIAKASGEVIGKHLPSDVALIVNAYSGLSTEDFKKGLDVNKAQISPSIPELNTLATAELPKKAEEQPIELAITTPVTLPPTTPVHPETRSIAQAGSNTPSAQRPSQKEWRRFALADLAVGLATTAVLFAVGIPVIGAVVLAATLIGAILLGGAPILAKRKAENSNISESSSVEPSKTATHNQPDLKPKIEATANEQLTNPNTPESTVKKGISKK